MRIRSHQIDWGLVALLYVMLMDAIRQRSSLMRLARIGLRIAKKGAIVLVGLSLTLIGGVMYGAIIYAVWQVGSTAHFQSIYDLIGSPIGWCIGVLGFGIPSTYTLAVGIWILAPRSRFATFVKVHLFWRRIGMNARLDQNYGF
jgi:hypothetical protein